MQATHQFSIGEIALKAITLESADRENVIYYELEKHIEDIASLLTSYHWHERAVVHALKIDVNSILIDQNGTGRFKVNYGTNIHYGCSDIDIELDNKMTINIRVDVQTGETILTGEYIPEREPDSF